MKAKGIKGNQAKDSTSKEENQRIRESVGAGADGLPSTKKM